ncbi:hypothetical protein CDD82_4910 [Ophiocordyceps australis]|uniref:Probable endonuclease LCL3 n=1 Tax=Ophiocordyceps australis TaxID=1399860 RepID=A0A2C5Z3W7_9HYPO|nr:hypothetical protein CDD82_4910 [Ophiocordyceps australis]
MVAISLVSLGVVQIYYTYLRRIPGARYLQPSDYHKKSLWGRVTSVGDGDNFHMFHMPGGRRAGWGVWRHVPTKRKDLKTISVRIAGVDAPEGAHFGRPSQPYAAEALEWLTQYIIGRNVRAYVYRCDQYDRAVASVYIWRYCIRRDVGLEMIKRGLATVYEGTYGAEYGGRKEVYLQAEAKAKKKRLGMWSGSAKRFESPRQYKTRWAAGTANSDK